MFTLRQCVRDRMKTLVGISTAVSVALLRLTHGTATGGESSVWDVSARRKINGIPLPARRRP